jgi:RNA polymerase sigma factor (sigma-70 family)
MDSQDIRQLVGRAASGHDHAWTQLVTLYRHPLERVGRKHRLSDHDVADVVQITWLRCIEHVHELREPECLLAWLLTTCRRESLRRVRELRHCVPQDAGDVLSSIAAVRDPEGDPYDHVQRQDDAARLYEAVAELPDRQRLVVLGLMQHGGDGYAQASRRIGVPIGSLGPTRNRALRRLRADQRVRGLA